LFSPYAHGAGEGGYLVRFSWFCFFFTPILQQNVWIWKWPIFLARQVSDDFEPCHSAELWNSLLSGVESKLMVLL
jgi:hypothetical protein